MNTVRICVQNAVRASVKKGIHLAAFQWGRGEESRLQSLHSGQGISSPSPLPYLASVGVICFRKLKKLVVSKLRKKGRSADLQSVFWPQNCLLSLTCMVVKLTVFVLYSAAHPLPTLLKSVTGRQLSLSSQREKRKICVQNEKTKLLN